MKKNYYILLVQIIFYGINVNTSLSDKKINSHEQIKNLYEISEKLYKEIDPTTIEDNDALAYTWLVQLRVRTYDCYFAIEREYSQSYINITKELFNRAVKNANQIKEFTTDQNIRDAYQATFEYAQKLLQNKK